VKQKVGRRPLRLGRLFDPSPLYFVTFCTHNRKPYLANDEIQSAFRSFAKRAEHDFNVAVGRYVIMPEHIHLFVRGGSDFVLGRWIGMLKQALAKARNLSLTRGQVWQEGFFDHVLRSDESYAEKWNYVRQNPVRAELVAHAEEMAISRRSRLHRSRIEPVATPLWGVQSHAARSSNRPQVGGYKSRARKKRTGWPNRPARRNSP
jgi:putative transposase